MIEKLYDLQMFASPNTVTGDPANPSSMSKEMKTYYSRELLENAKPNLCHTQFAKKVALPKNNGKNIEWRKFGNFEKATTPLTEGVTPDGKSLAVTDITAKVDQYGAYSTISDMVDMTAIDNVVLEYTQRHGENMGMTIDTICRNAAQAGTHVIYAGGKNSRDSLVATDKITSALVAECATFLKKMNAPKINGKYVAIIHPSVAYDLRQDQGWLDAHKYASPDEIFTGEIGELHGVRFIESTEAKIYNATGGAVYGCLFFGKDAFADVQLEGGNGQVIVKPLGSGDDPLNQRSTVGWKVSGYAAKILYDEYLVRLECCSTFSAKDTEN